MFYSATWCYRTKIPRDETRVYARGQEACDGSALALRLSSCEPGAIVLEWTQGTEAQVKTAAP